MPASLRRQHHGRLLKEENLNALLERYQGVQLTVSIGAMAGTTHRTYYLQTIQAALAYQTTQQPYNGGPLGTPGWIKETDLSLCGPDADGIERFLKEHERELINHQWIEP